MTTKRMRIIFVFIAAYSVFLLSCGAAYAGNGLRMLGFSSRDSAMAGATTASSADTSCLVRNPGGLVLIGNKIEVQYENILPHDVTMHTEGPNLATLGGAPFVNAGLRQKSKVSYIPGANGGISYRIPGTDRYPISVGLGFFTIAGVAVDYPSSRLNTAISGDYDKMVDLRTARIAPGLAVAFNDNLSFGGAFNFAIQALRSNLATATLVNGRYIETVGGGKWDYSTGAGFTVGSIYKFNEMLNLGASYESKTWMDFQHRYKDVLPLIDGPQLINMGVAFKPIKSLELTFDTRYINWTGIKLARNGPADGGFGWQDQWVFATGGEYTFKDKLDNDKLKLRLGYNYGKSPIQKNVIFANALLPVIMEHHLTTGFSFFLMKNLSLDVTWEHHFKNTKSDNGQGDVYSINGNGTKISAAGEVISAGLGYYF